MTGGIKRFKRNLIGRDFAVGDIHGHFTRLDEALHRIGFNRATDRLFSVGDLVDRGPECRRALDFLDCLWFHAVAGNHDSYVARYRTCDRANWIYNGGIWFDSLLPQEQGEFGARFADLPVAIEVETDAGLIGLVHADCPFPTWARLREELESQHLSNNRRKAIENYCQWSRERFETENRSSVADVRAVIVGHTPVRRPVVLGNVWHIDTGGWLHDGSGHFTIVDLESMKVVSGNEPSIALSWEAGA